VTVQWEGKKSRGRMEAMPASPGRCEQTGRMVLRPSEGNPARRLGRQGVATLPQEKGKRQSPTSSCPSRPAALHSGEAKPENRRLRMTPNPRLTSNTSLQQMPQIREAREAHQPFGFAGEEGRQQDG